MQTQRQQIVGKLTQLFFKSMLAAFYLVAIDSRGDELTDSCNSIVAGNLDNALSSLRKAASVLNESSTNSLEHEFIVISAAGIAKALEFLVEDSKAGKFPVEDCKTSAEAVLAFQQGQSQFATTKLQSLLGKHSSNPIIVLLASLRHLKMFKYDWYAEADGDKELREVFSGIDDRERRCLGAFFSLNNAFYRMAQAPSLSNEKPTQRHASSPQTVALEDAYNDFHAAIGYAPTARVRAASHLGALTTGKEVIQRIPRRGVLHGLAGKLVEGEEFRDVLAEHKSSLSAMGVQIPGGLSLPLSAKTWAIIGGILALAGYSYWSSQRRSQ